MTGPPRPARPLSGPLVSGWACCVAALGLALALLGPAPGPPAPLSPANVLARAEAELPSGAGAVRVAEVDGWRTQRHWHFLVLLAFRRHGRVAVESVILPPPAGVPAALPQPPGAVDYAGSPGLGAAQRALDRAGSAGCVFVPPRPGGCAG
jgi:hypothetical protein